MKGKEKGEYGWMSQSGVGGEVSSWDCGGGALAPGGGLLAPGVLERASGCRQL